MFRAGAILLFTVLQCGAVLSQLVKTIKDGYLQPDQIRVGTTTSELQAFIDLEFLPVTEATYATASLVDDSL